MDHYRTNRKTNKKREKGNMSEISRLVLLIGVAVSLGACSDEQVPPPVSRANYSPSPALVRKVQVALRNRGYYAGLLDGFFGQNTAIGVQRFQVDHHQRVSPIIDRSLRVSLGIASDM
jgi:hypothetical protein